MKMRNDWTPETMSLLNDLEAAGFKLTGADNGEDRITDKKGPLTKEQLCECLTATDESHLFVTSPEGRDRWLFLVYGNSPGELVCDYICDDGLDRVTETHYDKWVDRKQPMKEQE